MTHLRTNLLLLALSLVICCGVYPLALWAVGQTFFPHRANGSLLTAAGPDGAARVIGSSRIAQPFVGDEYFWPRPSAVSYNAAAAGGSNWGANNPKLRDRVARQLGPIVRYKKGSTSAGTGPEPRTPQQDVEEWFAADPNRAASGTDASVTEVHFDDWLQDPANRSRVADLDPVPADLATASGSGLDPHVTLRNALSLYQLDRVASKRTPPLGDGTKVRDDIAELVNSRSFAPLSGLVGEPLVNVLELNLELDRRFPVPSAPARPR